MVGQDPPPHRINAKEVLPGAGKNGLCRVMSSVEHMGQHLPS